MDFVWMQNYEGDNSPWNALITEPGYILSPYKLYTVITNHSFNQIIHIVMVYYQLIHVNI